MFANDHAAILFEDADLVLDFSAREHVSNDKARIERQRLCDCLHSSTCSLNQVTAVPHEFALAALLHLAARHSLDERERPVLVSVFFF